MLTQPDSDYFAFLLIPPSVRKKLDTYQQQLQAQHQQQQQQQQQQHISVGGGGSGGGPVVRKGLGAALNFKKEKEPSWLKVIGFTGHRDGIWDIASCKWDRNLIGTASVGMSLQHL
jgi:hypothetical protein